MAGIQIVTVPYRYDELNDGSGRGPRALVDHGLRKRLEDKGLEVRDPVEAILPDEERAEGPIALNVGKLGSHTASLVADARRDGANVLVISGDDTATVGVVAGLQQVHGAGAKIGLVWLDAHGDFNTPETSYSGILAGMPVAILAGLAGPVWRGAAGLEAPLPTDRILIAGVRELDEREATLMKSTDVHLIRGEELDGGLLHAALNRLAGNCDLLFLHVDLDLLDPSLVPSTATPSADGLSIKEASKLISTVLATGKVAVVSVAGLNPGAGDLGRKATRSAMALLETSLQGWGSAIDGADNAES